MSGDTPGNKQTAGNTWVGTGKRGPGRPKGSRNKTTTALKEAILQAGEDAHEDGLVGYLTEQAQENPTAFLTILGKVLPLVHAGDDTAPIVHTIERRIVKADNRDG